VDRRTFLAISLASAVPAPLAATAQQTAKVWRIGYLAFTPGLSDEAFRAQLNELGYVAGKNLVVEYRWASPDLDRYATLARELLDAGLDVIVAKSNRAVIAAKTLTGKIPIVGMTMLEPVETGIVKSLGRPGGNVTGLMWEEGPEQGAKKLEIFAQVVPNVARIAVVWNPSIPGLDRYWPPALDTAARLGYHNRLGEVFHSRRSRADLDRHREESCPCRLVRWRPIVTFAAQHSLRPCHAEGPANYRRRSGLD
jgi:putative ABC transport system substrate-binding protein